MLAVTLFWRLETGKVGSFTIAMASVFHKNTYWINCSQNASSRNTNNSSNNQCLFYYSFVFENWMKSKSQIQDHEITFRERLFCSILISEQGIIDINRNGNSAIFFSYVCNGIKIKDLFASTFHRKPARDKCVSSMIVV